MALFSLSVPLDVLTVSQHEQYAETEAAKRNSLIQFIIYTSAFITASKMSLTKKAHTLKWIHLYSIAFYVAHPLKPIPPFATNLS